MPWASRSFSWPSATGCRFWSHSRFLLAPFSTAPGVHSTPARDSRWLLRSGLLVVAIAVAVNWPLRFLDDGRWNEGLRLAQRLVITGDYPGADAWVERLERGAPRPGRAHHDVAMQLVVQGQTDRAVPHLRRSLERGFVAPMDDVEVWLSAGAERHAKRGTRRCRAALSARRRARTRSCGGAPAVPA